MRRHKLSRANLAMIGAGTLSFLVVPAHATFHLWKIDEVYSNASGTIQFIEFQQPNFEFDDERFLTQAGTVTDSTFANTFTFTSDLPSAPTANSHFLLASPGYAALPGVPTPDYILPTNDFFSISGDTITYAHGIDSLTFTGAQLPTDGMNSLNRAYGATTFTTGINSPTNFAGQTGTVVLQKNLTWNNTGGGSERWRHMGHRHK